MFQIVQINTEFVFFDTCGDIVMGMGIDIGIDAKGDPGFFAQPAAIPSITCISGRDSQLKQKISCCKASSISASLLPTPAYTMVSAGKPHSQCLPDFISADTVRSQSLLADQSQ